MSEVLSNWRFNKMPEFPTSISNINKRLQTLGAFDADRKARIIANIIAAQMLPVSALRGGTSLKIKFGDSSTRASSDLDVALAGDREIFIDQYKENLASGWNGFSGVLTPSKKKSKPKGVPQNYITETWNLKLSFRGGEWLKQEIDLAHDEIGDTSEAVYEASSEIWNWFEVCGLPQPAPIRVIKAEHQIAQKLHALVEDSVERIHDLVDLQVILKNQQIDYQLAGSICKQLFRSRKSTTWPPLLAVPVSVEPNYDSYEADTEISVGLSEAVDWCNKLITELNVRSNSAH
jgi:predicted nucleotidyltransferase component of viral defense system